jgi:hypothetical protein
MATSLNRCSRSSATLALFTAAGGVYPCFGVRTDLMASTGSAATMATRAAWIATERVGEERGFSGLASVATAELSATACM